MFVDSSLILGRVSWCFLHTAGTLSSHLIPFLCAISPAFQLMDLLMECINLELVLGNFYTRTALLSILSNVPDLEGFQRVTEQISSEFSALEEPFVVV